MHLNVTFFLQVFNFGITYWFLNKFMFKPVSVFIFDKKNKEEKIKKNLIKKEESLLEMEKKKDEELLIFQKNMKEKYKVPSLVKLG